MKKCDLFQVVPGRKTASRRVSSWINVGVFCFVFLVWDLLASLTALLTLVHMSLTFLLTPLLTPLLTLVGVP